MLFLDEPPNAIVLRSLPFRDYDRILHLLIREVGKVSVFQRNARRGKSKAYVVEPLDRGLVTIAGHRGRMAELTHFSPSRTLRRIRDKVDLFSLACLVTEAFDLALPEQQYEEDSSSREAGPLFECLESTLERLNSIEELREAFRATFECLESLLDQLGILASSNAPSLHGLLRHLDTLEAYAERSLLSRPLIEQTLVRLRADSSKDRITSEKSGNSDQ